MSMTQFVESLADQGRGGDTILAHITPEEAQLLKEHGGSGTVNPETGIMEFGFFSDLWNGFKKLVRAIAPIIIPAIAIFVPALIPAIGTYLGASAATAGIVGAAALSAGVTLASGGSLKEVLTSAALAGASTFLTPVLGKALTTAGASQLTQIMAGSAAFGAGYTALRGGSVKEMLAASATGAAGAYLGNIASSAIAKMNNLLGSGTVSSISEKAATDAVFAGADAANLKAAGLSQSQIADTLRASGLDSISADYAAAKAASGMGADDIAANLAANRPTGMYNGAANTKSITAGNNADLVQRVEDASFVAEDAARLKAQGLGKDQIVENLIASGVDKNIANTVASQAMQGQSASTIADNLTKSSGYLTSGKVYSNTADTINRNIGQVMTAEQQQSYDALPFKELVNSGKMTLSEASVLGQQNVTVQQATTLLNAGYTANDLSELIGAGTSVTTLTSLAQTKFPEATINDLLMNGISANDIAGASNALNYNPKNVTVESATQLLERGLSGNEVYNWTSKNTSASLIRALDSGISESTLNKLVTGGWNVDKVLTTMDTGKFDANSLNSKLSANSGYGTWLNSQLSTSVAPTQPTTTPTGPVSVEQQIINTGLVNGTDAAVLADGGYTANDVKNLLGAGYTAPDLVELASTGVPASTLNQLATTRFPEATINDMLMSGISANDIGKASGMVNLGGTSLETAQRVLNAGLTGTQLNVLNQGASVQKLLDAGMSLDKINSLYTSVGLDNVAKNIAKLDINAINNSTDPASVYKTQTTTTGAVKPVDPTQPTAPTVVSSEQQIINTGLVSGTDAAVLADSGYTATDVKNLINAGYTAADLTELASTGIPAKTLTSLAQTRFAESTINDMLMSGKSANDIAFASNMVNIGATTQANAEKILNSGATGTTAGSQLSTMLNNGNAVGKLLDAGLDASHISTLISKGTTALNTAVNNIGKFDPTLVNQSTDPTTSINNQIKYGYGNDSLYDIKSYGQGDTPGQVSIGADGERYVTLDSGKVVKYSDMQAALDSGKPVSIDGQIDTQFKIDASGVPKYAGMAGAGTAPSGYKVANPADIFGPNDTHNAQNPYTAGAYLDPETNTWFVPSEAQAPIPPVVVPPEPVSPPSQPTTPLPPQPPEIPSEPPVIPPTPIVPPVVQPPVVPPVVPPPVVPPVVQPPVVQPPVVQPPIVEPPPVVPPVVQPPVIEPPVVAPPVVPPVVQPPVIEPPVVAPPVVAPPVVPPIYEPPVTTPPVTTPVDPGTPGPGTPGPGTPGPGTPGPGTPGPGTPPVVQPPVVQPPIVEPPPPPPPPPEPPVVEPPVEPPVVEPPPEPPIVEPPVEPPPYIPIPPPIVPPDPTPPETRGTYTWGTPPQVKIPTGLNPGYITNVPQYYQPTNSAGSKYAWGSHPYQPSAPFNPQLYNQINAPVNPFGLGYAQRSATPEQILAAMRGYPTQSVTGPVIPR